MVKSFLKGIVIGIANIIPGVSGGTMMVAMGIYDKLIHCITHLFSEFKKNVAFLLPILIGMLVAIVGSSFGLEYLFENFPLQTTMLFIGLILGGLPPVVKKVKGQHVQIGHLIACAAFFALVVGMAALGDASDSARELTINLVMICKLFAVGVIASATMVIPGVSGSMVLMLMGYYHSILSAITDFMRALVALDVDGILHGFGILFPFGVGVLVGIFAIAKVIEIIFEKFPLYAYWAIIGLIVASPFAIVLMGSFTTITVVSVIVGIVCLAAGFFVSTKLGE
jgi:putative membrane protein